MKKFNISASFKTKTSRAGSRAAIITAAALILAIAVNIFAEMLPVRYTQLDTTGEELFSISDQTRQIVSEVDTDVTIYLLAESGYENATIVDLLRRYQDLNKHIDVEYKDIVLYPTFYEAYTEEEPNENSLIFESEYRSTVVDYDEIFVEEINYETYSFENYFDGENAVTSAIDYVAAKEFPKFYVLEGHGEKVLRDESIASLERENVEYEELSLIIKGQVPEDASCLFIMAPETDITEMERDAILEYLENGGKLIFMGNFIRGELPNLEAVLAEYGLEKEPGIVIEGDSSRMVYGYPTYCLPILTLHSITEAIKENNYYVLMPSAQGINISTTRDTLYTKSLMSSSSDSYAKLAGYDMTTTDKEEGDTDGAFILSAIAIEYRDEEQTTANATQIVWFGSEYMLDETVDAVVSGVNTDLFLNAVNWVTDREERSNIRTKSMMLQYLVVPTVDSTVWSVVVMVAIPLTVILIGVIVCVRRRKS